MCTVTYVRSGDKTIITSNRDEQVSRAAIGPKEYNINGKTILFPKDPKAGGTWFAIDQSATVLVLLNGAAEKHKWNPPYRLSRGLILLDVIRSESPYGKWKQVDLNGIEPFTMVLYEKGELFQLRWDEIEKSTVRLNPAENHIWSSTTLYPKEIRDDREHWFSAFITKNENPEPSDMFDFHRYTHPDDSKNGLVINREDFLKTISITQAVIGTGSAEVLHHDLLKGKDFRSVFETHP